MLEETPTQTETACGYVAIVGAPNAGKSTLLNQLVGAKISIVSSKVQTTRARITGIGMEGQTQLVYVDTPGIFAPKRRLDRAMVQAAWSGIDDADVILLVVDAARGFDQETRDILKNLDGRKVPAVLALNKVDKVAREKLLGLTQALNDAFPFAATFMIAASNGDGCKDLLRDLVARMPKGPWLYPEDQLSDAPMRFLAAEITREKLFNAMRQELPYALTVETENWKDQKNGSARIDQVIFVEREGQKKIVIGEGGAMLKKVGAAARQEMEKQFERRVHLFLFVKVRGDWGDDPERYEAMGLEFPKK